MKQKTPSPESPYTVHKGDFAMPRMWESFEVHPSVYEGFEFSDPADIAALPEVELMHYLEEQLAVISDPTFLEWYAHSNEKYLYDWSNGKLAAEPVPFAIYTRLYAHILEERLQGKPISFSDDFIRVLETNVRNGIDGVNVANGGKWCYDGTDTNLIKLGKAITVHTALREGVRIHPFMSRNQKVKLYTGDDSYGGMGWDYPAASMDLYVMLTGYSFDFRNRVLAGKVSSDRFQLLLPNLRKVEISSIEQVTYTSFLFNELERGIMDEAERLAVPPLIQGLGHMGIIIEQDQRLVRKTRFHRIQGYVDSSYLGKREEATPRSINEDVDLSLIRPDIHRAGRPKGKLAVIGMEFDLS